MRQRVRNAQVIARRADLRHRRLDNLLFACLRRVRIEHVVVFAVKVHGVVDADALRGVGIADTNRPRIVTARLDAELAAVIAGAAGLGRADFAALLERAAVHVEVPAAIARHLFVERAAVDRDRQRHRLLARMRLAPLVEHARPVEDAVVDDDRLLARRRRIVRIDAVLARLADDVTGIRLIGVHRQLAVRKHLDGVAARSRHREGREVNRHLLIDLHRRRQRRVRNQRNGLAGIRRRNRRRQRRELRLADLGDRLRDLPRLRIGALRNRHLIVSENGRRIGSEHAAVDGDVRALAPDDRAPDQRTTARARVAQHLNRAALRVNCDAGRVDDRRVRDLDQRVRAVGGDRRLGGIRLHDRALDGGVGNVVQHDATFDRHVQRRGAADRDLAVRHRDVADDLAGRGIALRVLDGKHQRTARRCRDGDVGRQNLAVEVEDDVLAGHFESKPFFNGRIDEQDDCLRAVGRRSGLVQRLLHRRELHLADLRDLDLLNAEGALLVLHQFKTGCAELLRELLRERAAGDGERRIGGRGLLLNLTLVSAAFNNELALVARLRILADHQRSRGLDLVAFLQRGHDRSRVLQADAIPFRLADREHVVLQDAGSFAAADVDAVFGIRQRAAGDRHASHTGKLRQTVNLCRRRVRDHQSLHAGVSHALEGDYG